MVAYICIVRIHTKHKNKQTVISNCEVLIFNLRNNKIRQLYTECAINVVQVIYIQEQRMKGATYCMYFHSSLRKAWTRVPRLETHDSSKLSHVSGYTLARFGLGRIVRAPKGPTQASYYCQAQPILNMA